MQIVEKCVIFLHFSQPARKVNPVLLQVIFCKDRRYQFCFQHYFNTKRLSDKPRISEDSSIFQLYLMKVKLDEIGKLSYYSMNLKYIYY